LDHGRPIIANQPGDDPRSTGVPTGHIPIQRFISVPVLFGSKLVGQVALANKPADYDARDLSVIERLGFIYGLALERSRSENELVAAKDAAERANRAKSQFLASMSHEIRTPLNAVIGFANLVLDEITDPVHREHLTQVSKSASHLLNLINDILDLSKIESGAIELENEPFSPHLVIQEVLNGFALEARGKGLELLADLDEDVPEWLRGDAGRIRQILLNLVGNAVKFTRAGHIRITAKPGQNRDRRRELILRVADTGIGIPPAKRDMIFNTFTQADSSHTREYGGTGLGLSIAKRLIERMGGDISVDSDPGLGSTFTFNLWLDQYRPPAGTGESAGVKPPDSRTRPAAASLNVLVAEDNPVNQRLASALLTKKGHRVRVADNGGQAVALFREGDFDVILMDVEMPIMDGLTASRRIREMESRSRSQPIPILAMTAHAMKGDRERCLEAGMNDFIAKPVNAAELFDALDTIAG
jgi:signal transduction histidine kinase/CheY-like chemotaxis protein